MVQSDPVLTLRDLAAWPSAGGTALAVLGQPIKHSISPAMHNAALHALARRQPDFDTWRYHRFEVAPADLPAALRQFHAAGFFGLNLTVPHKVIAFEHVAEIDPDAVRIGAVNTLRRTASGWRGFNTDGYGLAAGIAESLHLDLAGTPVLLLGAGGAARAAAVECLRRRCASLWIANRTPANLAALVAVLAPLAPGLPLRGFAPDAPPADFPAGTLVINATSAGLRPDDPSPINLAALPRPAALYDMIYNPPETPLLRAAVALGVPHAHGLSMLVHQGAKALEIWSGASAAETAPTMTAAACAALGLM